MIRSTCKHHTFNISQPNRLKTGHITQIPDELLVKIFSYLPRESFLDSRKVCKKWYEVSHEPLLLAKRGNDLRIFRTALEYQYKSSIDKWCLWIGYWTGFCGKMLSFEKIENHERKILNHMKVLDVKHLRLNKNVPVRNEDLKHLPHNLTCLDLSGLKSITEEGLRYLPTNLTTLNVSRCPLNLDENLFENLPRNLKFLNLKYCYKVGYSTLKNLPPNLLGLKIEKIVDFESLPSSLTSLNCRELCAGKCPSTMYEQLAGKFPQLSELKIGRCTRISNNVTVFPSDTLKILKLSSSWFGRIEEPLAPKTMPSFALKFNISLIDSDIENLSNGLTCLTLDHCGRITNLGLKALPSTLEKVKISFCENITNECFKFLPRKLKELTFRARGNGGLGQPIFSCLPKDLESLTLSSLYSVSLRISCDFSTDPLPSQLKSLQLDNFQIENSLSYLPLSLTHLKFKSCTKVAKNHFMDLPENLHRLILKRCSDIPEKDVAKLQKIKPMLRTTYVPAPKTDNSDCSLS